MPIGNQEIWNKGIGMGATQAVFGGAPPAPAATNFNPGALGADPDATPAATTATDTPAVPATPDAPSTGGATSNPLQPGGTVHTSQSGGGPYAKQLQNAQLKMQQLQQQLQYAMSENEKRQIQYRMQQQLQEIQKWETANAKWA